MQYTCGLFKEQYFIICYITIDSYWIHKNVLLKILHFKFEEDISCSYMFHSTTNLPFEVLEKATGPGAVSAGYCGGLKPTVS